MFYQHKHPFADGNLVSVRRSTQGSAPWNFPHAADLIVCMSTMRVLKDRYEALATRPDRVLIRLYEAIESDEKVLVLT
jgi:hypothetical protein